MAVSPDGKHLATASKDGITRVFELSTAQLCGGFKVGPHTRSDASVPDVTWTLYMAVYPQQRVIRHD